MLTHNMFRKRVHAITKFDVKHIYKYWLNNKMMIVDSNHVLKICNRNKICFHIVTLSHDIENLNGIIICNEFIIAS